MAPTPNGKWYDAGNVGEMHDDLRTSYQKTLRTMMARPGLKRHFEDCATCQEIKAGSEAAAQQPPAARRRKKYVIRPSDMAALLDLAPGEQIVIMYADLDPNVIKVLVTGPTLDEIDEAVETPVVRVLGDAA